MSWTPLNWKELALYIARVGPRIERLAVDRAFVPRRDEVEGGFMKDEWALKTSRGTLLLGLRTQQPYWLWIEDEQVKSQGLQAAAQATRSPFGLELSKRVRGLKIESVEVPPRERQVILWFQGRKQALVWVGIPQRPEALWVERPEDSQSYHVVCRSRVGAETDGVWQVPLGSASAPQDLQVREIDPERLARELHDHLAVQGLEQARKAALRILSTDEKLARERLDQAERALADTDGSEGEAEWRRRADDLKQTLAQGDKAAVAAMQKAYAKAQRLARKREESQRRKQDAWDKLERLARRRAQIEGALTLADLRGAGQSSKTQTTSDSQVAKKRGAWEGKSFRTREGLLILIGRSQAENRTLVIRHARSADFWLHLRGRPSAHAIVVVPAGKSASLESLIDAAQLVIHFSGGRDWGKTEVDYTQRKNVRSIKGSSEFQYSGSKLLWVTPEPERLKRLFDAEV